jgi:hypothetical protein
MVEINKAPFRELFFCVFCEVTLREGGTVVGGARIGEKQGAGQSSGFGEWLGTFVEFFTLFSRNYRAVIVPITLTP